MSEAILKALMQLFALIVDIDEIQEISEKERAIIRAFLVPTAEQRTDGKIHGDL